MNVSKQFLRDLAFLANLYGWSAADIEEVKEQTRSSPTEMRAYWTALATAHRAGYSQTAQNNFVRLGRWLQIGANAATGQTGFSAVIACAREGAS